MADLKNPFRTGVSLISTRLEPPTLRSDMVFRPRLQDELCNGFQPGGSLCVLTAPAGYGKSLLMSQCFHAFVEAGWSAVWLDLDEHDNDEQVFFLYLQEAIRRLTNNNPTINHPYLLSDAVDVDIDFALLGFTRAISSAHNNHVLFVDDFHLLHSRKLHEFFQNLLKHIPDNLKLVIGSRTPLPVPLSKLKTSGKLTLLDIDQLRFDRNETNQLFLDTNKLELSDTDLELLYRRTSGWVAIMQLAALSIRGAPDRTAFIKNFTSAVKPVSEFLSEEVFAMMPEESASFLMRIAVADRVCPSLCAAITKNDALSSKLDTFCDASLLVQSLDREGYWFRIHPIVRDFLLRQLKVNYPGEKKLLHRRVARWFEEQGLYAEAIDNAISADDETLALELLEERGMRLIDTGYLSLLFAQIRRLPDHILRNSLNLLVQLAWVEVLNSRIGQTRRLLDEIKKILRSQKQSSDIEWAQAIEIEVGISAFSEDFVGGVKLVSDWMSKIPAEAKRVSGSLRCLEGFVSLNAFDYDRALEASRRVLELGNNLEMGLTRSYGACIQSMAYYHRGLMKQGMVGLKTHLTKIHQRLGESSQAVRMVESMLAANHYQQGNLENARHLFKYIEELHHILASPEHLLVVVPVRARLFQVGDDHRKTVDYLLEAHALAEKRRWIRLEAKVLQELVRVYLHLGEPDNAAAIYDVVMQKRANSPDNSRQHLAHSRSWCEMARARILAAEGKTLQATSLVGELQKEAITKGRVFHALELGVLLARLKLEAGESSAAVGIMKDAFKLDRENSCVQVFRDEGDTVMKMLDSSREQICNSPFGGTHVIWQQQIRKILGEETTLAEGPPADVSDRINSNTHHQMVEQLTKREQEILSHLSRGLSNKDISCQLNVSINTIKTHLQSAYGKLDVSSRMQAVIRMKELGIS